MLDVYLLEDLTEEVNTWAQETLSYKTFTKSLEHSFNASISTSNLQQQF